MRSLTTIEIGFLTEMLKRNNCTECNIDLSALQVESADDGGMGSLIFWSPNSGRCLGRDISKIEFEDKDGVKVIATLSTDNFGDLYELDIWKTNFEKLLELRL